MADSSAHPHRAAVPAPILADLLGLHIQTATARARHAAADWAAYLAARIDNTATTDTATTPAADLPR